MVDTLINIEKIEDFTVADMEKVTLRDLNAFTAYLKEYETDTVSIDGKHIKRIRRNSAYGINRKLSGIRGLFSYLYKNDLISQNVTDKLDFKTASKNETSAYITRNRQPS